MDNDKTNEDSARHRAVCLLGHTLARQRKHMTIIEINMVVNVGRISVTLSDDLEKVLRFKTIERFGGKKGDLTKAVEEAVQTWVTKEN
jgi:hypothetical protein